MNARPDAPAARRNAAAVLGVLRSEFAEAADVLEIGSGTGQHAVMFGSAMPGWRWQTSDLETEHAGIRAWMSAGAADNVLDPIHIDVRVATARESAYDAVFSANTAHIMSMDAVVAMFAYSGTSLRDGGLYALYGPFRRNGQFNTPSNEKFHRSLKERDPEMGIRELEILDELAGENSLQRLRLYAMPANNHLVFWQRCSRSHS